MNALLPPSYWDALRHLSEPFELMKFSLIFDGDLPAGHSSRAIYASKIRNALHDQLADLWDSHVILRQLARTARVRKEETHVMKAGVDTPELPNYDWPIPPVPEGYIDLCAPIQVKGAEQVGWFLPLVRNSLYLSCFVDLLFLRHEEPFELFRAGGDLDNRIKCFFDGLKVPDLDQARNGEVPTGDPLYCLLQDDRQISGFSVRTGRLLGRGEKKKHAVRITSEITINVLRVMDENICLLGG